VEGVESARSWMRREVAGESRGSITRPRLVASIDWWATRATATWGWRTTIGSTTVSTIAIRVIISRWWTVRVIIPGARGRVIIWWTAARGATRWWTSITVAVSIIVIASRGPPAVVVPTILITTSGTAFVVVVSWTAGITTTWGARSEAIARTLGLLVSNAVNRGAFELATIELLNGRKEVSFGLVLYESSAIALSADFGVDNIQSGLTGKVFKILPAGLNGKTRYAHPEGSPSGTWSSALLVSKVLIPT